MAGRGVWAVYVGMACEARGRKRLWEEGRCRDAVGGCVIPRRLGLRRDVSGKALATGHDENAGDPIVVELDGMGDPCLEQWRRRPVVLGSPQDDDRVGLASLVAATLVPD